MDLTVTSKLIIAKGHAILPFPPVLKREALSATILCQSLAFMDNEEALNEPFFVVCSGSTYYTQDKQVKRNILGMFQNKKEANMYPLNYSHKIRTKIAGTRRRRATPIG